MTAKQQEYSITLKFPDGERDVSLVYDKEICERETNWNKEFTRNFINMVRSNQYQRGEYITEIKGDGPAIPLSDSICYFEGLVKNGENQPIPFGILFELKNELIKIRGIGPNEYVVICNENPKMLAGISMSLISKPHLLDKVWLYSINKQFAKILEDSSVLEQNQASTSKKNWWEFWK